jgi:hypothetical protein
LNRNDRAITGTTFLLLGPLIGALSLWLYITCMGLVRGELNEIALALEALPIVLVGGYIAGFLPALLAGIIYASLPARWQRVVVSLFIGAFAALPFSFIVDSILPGGMSPAWMFVGPGAVAAAACAFTARQIIKLLGREYDHTGGIGGA